MSIPRRELYQKFNLIDETRKGTQNYILNFQIFTENQNKCITKREVEKQLVL